MKHECHSCAYWVRIPSDNDGFSRGFGYCRRFPPIFHNPNEDRYGRYTDKWPYVAAADWCGEWKDKEKPDADTQ